MLPSAQRPSQARDGSLAPPAPKPSQRPRCRLPGAQARADGRAPPAVTPKPAPAVAAALPPMLAGRLRDEGGGDESGVSNGWRQGCGKVERAAGRS